MLQVMGKFMEQISKKTGTGLRMAKSSSVGLVVKKYWNAVLQLNTQLDQMNSEVWTGIFLFTFNRLTLFILILQFSVTILL